MEGDVSQQDQPQPPQKMKQEESVKSDQLTSANPNPTKQSHNIFKKRKIVSDENDVPNTEQSKVESKQTRQDTVQESVITDGGDSANSDQGMSFLILFKI